MMLPRATPKKIPALVRAFLVVPPMLEDTKDNAKTKTAFEDPVTGAP